MDTDPDTTTLIKTEHDHLSIESYPESLDQVSEDIKPLRTDVSIEILTVEPRCVNCGRDITQKRSHKLARASVEVIAVIRQWIAPQLIGEDDEICHSCFLLSLRENNIEVSDGASNGRHRQLCVTCQCSLLRKRFHKLNTSSEREAGIRDVVIKEIAPKQLRETDQICHPCWSKWDRKFRQPEPEALPSVIHLPNITRAPDNQGCCFYPNCDSSQRKTVPRWLRVKLFTDLNFYVSSKCKLCHYHLTNHDWDALTSNPKPIHKFTAEHIEDFASFVKERNNTLDFNNIDEMEDDAVKYWTGLTKIQFRNVFARLPQLHKYKNGQVALACYLMKLKTSDPVAKMANLVNIPRSTLTRIMHVARTALQDLPDDVVPTNIGNDINNDDDNLNADGDDE